MDVFVDQAVVIGGLRADFVAVVTFAVIVVVVVVVTVVPVCRVRLFGLVGMTPPFTTIPRTATFPG